MLDDRFEITIVDEDPRFAQALAALLESSGFRAQVTKNLQEAMANARISSCDFLLVSFQGQGTLNIQYLRQLIRTLSSTRLVALVTEELESYEELLRQTGIGLIFSRQLSPKHIAQLVITQGEVRRLEEQNFHLREMIDGRMVYGNLIGGSPPMRALYRLLDQIARTDAPVLVTGEEGTERAEVARAVHAKSERASNPIVVIDCQEGLTDPSGSFIFGPQGNGRNANGPCPTGSAFARAGKGCLVLHKIESLSIESQHRLLEFLHHPFFQNETPGSPLPLARIMATAGPNLLGKVEAGEFQRELFYRLNILQVRVPPLRERREDIPMLAQHYLRTVDRRASGRSSSNGISFSSRVLLNLFQYDWPGNVEELETLMHQVAATVQGPQIEVEDLPAQVQIRSEAPSEPKPNGQLNVPLKEAKRLFESEYFKCLLLRTQGNMTMASRFSRVGRPYLYKKIREYGLMPEEFR